MNFARKTMQSGAALHHNCNCDFGWMLHDSLCFRVWFKQVKKIPNSHPTFLRIEFFTA